MKGRNGRKAQGGFTVLELLLVILVLGILASILAPSLRGAVTKARATSIIGDLHVIRVAAYNHLADKDSWPLNAQPGAIPTTLRPYLPDGFSFRNEDYTLDFDHFAGNGPSGPHAEIVIAVYVKDPELREEVRRKLSSAAWARGEPKFEVSSNPMIAF